MEIALKPIDFNKGASFTGGKTFLIAKKFLQKIAEPWIKFNNWIDDTFFYDDDEIMELSEAPEVEKVKETSLTEQLNDLELNKRDNISKHKIATQEKDFSKKEEIAFELYRIGEKIRAINGLLTLHNLGEVELNKNNLSKLEKARIKEKIAVLQKERSKLVFADQNNENILKITKLDQKIAELEALLKAQNALKNFQTPQNNENDNLSFDKLREHHNRYYFIKDLNGNPLMVDKEKNMINNDEETIKTAKFSRAWHMANYQLNNKNNYEQSFGQAANELYNRLKKTMIQQLKNGQIFLREKIIDQMSEEKDISIINNLLNDDKIDIVKDYFKMDLPKEKAEEASKPRSIFSIANEIKQMNPHIGLQMVKADDLDLKSPAIELVSSTDPSDLILPPGFELMGEYIKSENGPTIRIKEFVASSKKYR